MSSQIPILRDKIISRLATVTAIGTTRAHAGRPAGRMTASLLAKGPRAWTYFRREDFQPISKGASGRAVKCLAEFAVEVWSIAPATEPDVARDPSALEDLLDELSLSCKRAIETDVRLQNTCLLCTVTEREVDIDGSTDSDLGAALIGVQVLYISTEGEG